MRRLGFSRLKVNILALPLCGIWNLTYNRADAGQRDRDLDDSTALVLPFHPRLLLLYLS